MQVPYRTSLFAGAAVAALAIVGAAAFILSPKSELRTRVESVPTSATPNDSQPIATNPAPDQKSPPGFAGNRQPPSAKRADGPSKTAPLLVPITDDSPMSPYRFEGQSATVGPAEKKVVLDGMLGTGSVASLVANVATPVRVRIPSTVSGETVVISAPNGGKIERRNGRLAFPANGGPLDLDLVFTPTLGNGAYTISIRHAGDLLTYQFWAGPRRPSGQPGTPYVPPSPETLAAEVASLSTDQRAAE